MNDTPTLTHHARVRCREMGISTKVAKAIVKHADVVQQSSYGPEYRVAKCDRHPDYAVVYAEQPDGAPPAIVTVIFRVTDFGKRDGTTYIKEAR